MSEIIYCRLKIYGLRVMIFSDESGSMHISENKSNWVCIFYTGFFQKMPNLSGRKYKKKV